MAHHVAVSVGLPIDDRKQLKMANRRLHAAWVDETTVALAVVARQLPDKTTRYETTQEDQGVFVYDYAPVELLRAQLIQTTACTFLSVQALHKGSDEIPPIQKQVLSREYRRRLEQHIMAHEASAPEEALLVRDMSAVWHLAEIVFVSSILSSDRFTSDFVRWLQMHFPVGADDQHDPWKTIYQCVLRNDLTGIAQTIAHMKTDLDDLTQQALDNLMRVIKNFQPGAKGKAIVQAFKQSLGPLSDSVSRPVLQLCDFMLGSPQTINDVCAQINASWMEQLAAKVLFVDPSIQSFDVGDYMTELRQARQSTLDDLFLAILDLNPTKALELASSIDLWLVAHLADFWDFCSVFELASDQPGTRWRDFFVLQYGQWLMSHDDFWQHGVFYLKTVPQGQDYIVAHLEHLPLRSQSVIDKVLDVCSQLHLTEVTKSTHRRVARACVHQGQIGRAMSHYDAAGDRYKVAQLSEVLLAKYWTQGWLDFTEIVDSLGHAAFNSDQPAFISYYAQFHELYRAKEFQQAGKLLIDIITNTIAPKHFWPVLLVDAIPLLEDSQIIFSVDNTYELMRCLEECLSPAWRPRSAVTISRDQLAIVQLALVRNLARASIAGDPIAGVGPLTLSSGSIIQ